METKTYPVSEGCSPTKNSVEIGMSTKSEECSPNQCRCCFKPEEVQGLKALLSKGTVTYYKVFPDLDKNSRVKCTYNISVSIKERLNEYCKDSLLNNSDIVNMAIIQYLEEHSNT